MDHIDESIFREMRRAYGCKPRLSICRWMRRGGRRLPELPETMRSLCVAAVAVGRKEVDKQVEANIAAAHAFQRWRLLLLSLYVADWYQIIWLAADSNM
jgi:hypothetical protein